MAGANEGKGKGGPEGEGERERQGGQEGSRRWRSSLIRGALLGGGKGGSGTDRREEHSRGENENN